jgi:hypothetical protein
MSKDAVAIIPCTNQKSDTPGPAREVWIGGHFQLVLAHAEIFYDRVYVMSYKYGLITPEQHIEPYDIDIRTAGAGDKLRWWAKMKGNIKDLCETDPPLLVSLYTGNVERERIIREFVRNGVRQVLVPFDGASIGRRMEMVYDLEPPFDRERALEGAYELPEDYGQSKVEDGKTVGNKYAPPPSQITEPIEWEE